MVDWKIKIKQIIVCDLGQRQFSLNLLFSTSCVFCTLVRMLRYFDFRDYMHRQHTHIHTPAGAYANMHASAHAHSLSLEDGDWWAELTCIVIVEKC